MGFAPVLCLRPTLILWVLRVSCTFGREGFGFIALASIRMAVIPLEEKALLVTFGDQYRDYMRHTGRLLRTA